MQKIDHVCKAEGSCRNVSSNYQKAQFVVWSTEMVTQSDYALCRSLELFQEIQAVREISAFRMKQEHELY